MSGVTTPDSIPYMTATDPLAGLDEHSLALANRLQALFQMLQGTSASITPTAADTPTTKRIDFVEAFTGGNPPQVVVCLGESVAGTARVTLWVVNIDNTGFTLGINSSGTAARTVRYIAVP